MKRHYTLIGAAFALWLCTCFIHLYAGTSYIESLKFKDTNIRMVLQAIASEANRQGENINIIATPDVEGFVSIDLKNIDWRTALKVILQTYNYGYTQRGDVITVSGFRGLTIDTAVKMELFKFKYLYADVASKLIAPLLSAEGKVSILEIPEEKIYASQADIGTGTSASGTSQGTPVHSKILIVSDTPDRLSQISTLLSELDVMPKQVLIQAIIMEVNRDTLKDIGFEWGTGSDGVTATNPADIGIGSGSTIAGRSISSAGNFTPGAFNPMEGTQLFPGTFPYKAGLELLFKKIAGTSFEVIVHALEEDVRTNTLSKPVILTSNNQLASILIGTKFPIIETQTSTESSTIVGGSLQQYMDIGVQLRVRPQISGPNEDYINLLIHPIVSSYTQTSKVTTQAGVTLVEYPIVNTREAETQMILKDGETIVMGGLLKDVKVDEDLGVPVLSKIPLLGKLFTRTTNDKSKVDLMIFITAKIVRPGEVLPHEVIDTQTLAKQFSEHQDEKKGAPKRKSSR